MLAELMMQVLLDCSTYTLHSYASHYHSHNKYCVYMLLINRFTGENQVWGEEFGACAYVQCSKLVLVSSVKDLSIRLV